MINVLFLCWVLIISPVTGAFWSSVSPYHHHQVAVTDGHRVVIKFEDDGKVSVSQPGDSGVFNKLKNRVSDVLEETKRFQEHATEVIHNAVGKASEKVIGVIGKATTEVERTIGIVDEDTKGSIKDSVVKLEEWDFVDSPKRICEDIGHNVSAKIEEGVEEMKETVEHVTETSPNAVNDILNAVLSWGSVMGFCHLLGFSTAYGMGVWVTFYSGCALGKCLTKKQSAMVLNTMNMVYFRAMGCCVGAALCGFVASRGTRGCLFNKIEMFQGFSLVSALAMILINLIILEPRATKFIAQKIKGTNGNKSVAAEKLKKINAYISTLNVSTVVVLTCHLAYIGQLLQA